AVTAMAPGLTGIAGGRPAVQPVVRLASCLLPKSNLTIEIFDGVCTPYVAAARAPQSVQRDDPPRPTLPVSFEGTTVAVPLLRLAHARSGDKGDTSNIGVLARKPVFLPVLASALTSAAVRRYFAHLVDGEVERFAWPGLDGFNFVLRRALGGGGIASLRYDPQGKSYAQILLDFPVRVPTQWLEPGGVLSE
ncbi:MAG TPA: hypothetical protein VFX59_14170, partial [Polyangiales bacterium]|nr:hypothetical protein [Polyangiales bacterium]